MDVQFIGLIRSLEHKLERQLKAADETQKLLVATKALAEAVSPGPPGTKR